MVLEIRELRVELMRRNRPLNVLNGVDLSLAPGQTIGLVGESGSGKSMLCRAILGLLPRPNARVCGGQIVFDGQDLLRLSNGEMSKIRGKWIGYIPQEPSTALNPVLTIGSQLMETLRRHRNMHGKQLVAEAVSLLNSVHIPSPRERLWSYPNEMSGGMCQRSLAAIALSGQPRLLLADEPTTALDATLQFQFLLLLREIQRQTRCSILFVTHDLGLVAQLCDHLYVMYGGTIVERGLTETVLHAPRHPYTKALLASVPQLAVRSDKLPSISGQPPPLDNLPVGCLFWPRCQNRAGGQLCKEERPPRAWVSETHQVACWEQA